MTSPLRDWEIVLGKYLASLGVFAAMVVLTAGYPLLLLALGNPDVGPMLSGYLGYLLLGAAMLAIGVLASSLTQNQIVAAVLGIGANLLLWVAGDLGDLVGDRLRAVVEYLPPLPTTLTLRAALSIPRTWSTS